MTKGGIWHWKEIISSAMRLQSQNALGQMQDAIALDDYHRAAAELPVIAERLVDLHSEKLADFFAQPRPPFGALHGPRHAAVE